MYGEYVTRLVKGEMKRSYLPPLEYREAYYRFKLLTQGVTGFFYSKGMPVRLRFRPTQEALDCPSDCMPVVSMRLEVVYNESIIGHIYVNNNMIDTYDSVEVRKLVLKYLMKESTQMRIEFANMRKAATDAYEMAY
jgi:hypothetical protein